VLIWLLVLVYSATYSAIWNVQVPVRYEHASAVAAARARNGMRNGGTTVAWAAKRRNGGNPEVLFKRTENRMSLSTGSSCSGVRVGGLRDLNIEL
jgi:hypothetical protein